MIYNDDGDQIWPPTLASLLDDAGSQVKPGVEDDALQITLDAAIEYIEGKRTDLAFDASGVAAGKKPPTADFRLGTVRLALRWHFRRRALAGFVDSGDFGVQRLPATDDDLHRMLGIGKYARPVAG